MIPKRWPSPATIVVAFLAWSCAGDGTGLDEFGNRMGPDSLELGPTLSALQRYVFDPACTQCHTGAAAPLGLVLDSGYAQQYLVDVPSIQIPALLRVQPGNPDSSYMVWKIEGRSGIVGARMPLGMQPLSSEQISAIREWIANGAEAN